MVEMNGVIEPNPQADDFEVSHRRVTQVMCRAKETRTLEIGTKFRQIGVRVSVKWLRLSGRDIVYGMVEDSAVIQEQGRNFVIRNGTPVLGLMTIDWIYIGAVMLRSIAEIGGRGLAPLGTALSRTL